MKTMVYTDGFEGWAKRARARAKMMDAGDRLAPTREITFENAAEMVRLFTPSRLTLFEKVKKQAASISDLAASLDRQVTAVRRDVSALERHGIVRSEYVVNPGHGRVRVVSGTGGLVISARL